MSKLLEVARLAGVSKATVSRVINNSGPVSSELRQKVLDAMRKLGVQPGEMKRTPASNGVLGIIMPFGKQIWSHSFGIDILTGAEEKAFEENCLILLGNSNGGREKALVESMLGRGVEGLVVMSTERGRPDHLEQAQRQVPLVLVDQKIESFSAHLVRGDNFLGAVALMDHLIGQGHRRIALLSPDTHFSYLERIRGYRQTLRANGIRLPETFEAIGDGGDNYDVAARLDKMLREKERPTALFVASPGLLGKLIGALHRRGLRIPDDISVVTFDEAYAALPEGYENFFTSINQSGKLAGSMAVELLFRQRRDPELAPQEIVLPGTFTARRSVRPL
jgi:DNA-binding LacI/PurR family transcriptional regulator